MRQLFCLGFLFLSFNLSGEIVEKIQAQAGEEMISLIDLKNFRRQISSGLLPSSLLAKRAQEKSHFLKDRKKLLDFMIDRSMLYQIAQKEKLPKVSEKAIEAKFQQIKGSDSHKAFARKLKKAGLTSKTLKEQILIGLKNDLLISHWTAPKSAVSEQDIESYHFNKYGRPLFKSFEYEFVSVRFPESHKEAILKKIKLTGFSDLEKAAQALGLEPKISKLKQRDIQPVFKKELDKLSVSQISPLLILGDSYYILQLKWKYPRISPKEQKKKSQIERILFQKRQKEAVQKWIQEKRADFSIIRHSL